MIWADPRLLRPNQTAESRRLQVIDQVQLVDGGGGDHGAQGWFTGRGRKSQSSALFSVCFLLSTTESFGSMCVCVSVGQWKMGA